MLLRSVQDLVYRFTIGREDIQVGAVQFSDRATIEFDLDDYLTQRSLSDRIGVMRPMLESTDMAEGFRVLQTLFTASRGDRANAPNRAVLITDGRPDDADRALLAANRLKNAGIHLTVVGVGHDTVNPTELERLASQSGGVVLVTSFNDLANAVDRIVRLVCPPFIPGRLLQEVI